MKNLLLLTGTLEPNSGIKKQGYSKTIDVGERLKQYISTILYYLSIDEIDALVFIDNSMYNIDTTIIEYLKGIAKKLNKDIEFLKFQGNVENQLKYTYGYGEFETLKFMYENSKIFHKNDSIYKVTGRYKIYNISDLITHSQGQKNLFYKYNLFNFSGLNMVFFKISTENILKTIHEYDSQFIKNFDSKIKLGGEEILFNILKGQNLESIRIYPYFYTLKYCKYGFYQLLTKVGFFDLRSYIYITLSGLASIIPDFIKIYFNQLLRFILKFFK